ncbi:unnamed protein product [Brassicogethes aeneus]|uniref:Uncharacterized protein n=1 Tax=Brassicogethes aeneus TaxID=1431903 RepID=A0A9P0FBI1_BRAAE|nr:unnamed protein product [Brassicogethes aeneus]
MTEIDLDLLLNYPLIKKQRTTEGFSYTGVVEVNNVDYKVKLKYRKNKFIFHDLDKLNSIKNELNKEIGEKKDLSELKVLDYFRDYVKSLANNGGILINKSYLYRKVLMEYIEFTKFYLNLTKCQLSDDFMKIFISMQDENKREHSIVISIDDSEVNNIFKLEKYDLPIKPIKNNSNLTVLFDQFLATVEVLKPYFDFMEHLDNTAWILDPVEPKKCHNYRRIYLGENTSVTVRVDAYNIKLRPEILFLGPERIVEIYRDNLNSNLDTWDENGDPYTQLLKILGENYCGVSYVIK